MNIWVWGETKLSRVKFLIKLHSFKRMKVKCNSDVSVSKPNVAQYKGATHIIAKIYKHQAICNVLCENKILYPTNFQSQKIRKTQ